jgi:hypothetical protein
LNGFLQCLDTFFLRIAYGNDQSAGDQQYETDTAYTPDPDSRCGDGATALKKHPEQGLWPALENGFASIKRRI